MRHIPEAGAVCGNSARTDLCGGQGVTSVPTATCANRVSHTASNRRHSIASNTFRLQVVARTSTASAFVKLGSTRALGEQRPRSLSTRPNVSRDRRVFLIGDWAWPTCLVSVLGFVPSCCLRVEAMRVYSAIKAAPRKISIQANGRNAPPRTGINNKTRSTIRHPMPLTCKSSKSPDRFFRFAIGHCAIDSSAFSLQSLHSGGIEAHEAEIISLYISSPMR